MDGYRSSPSCLVCEAKPVPELQQNFANQSLKSRLDPGRKPKARVLVDALFKVKLLECVLCSVEVVQVRRRRECRLNPIRRPAPHPIRPRKHSTNFTVSSKVGLHTNSSIHPFRFTNINAIILMSLTCFFIAFYA